MLYDTEERRVRKTKRAIRNAFAALLAEKDVNQITVKDIADRADINRKTFYNHYRGVYQVMDEIENSIVDDFDRMLREASGNSDGDIHKKSFRFRAEAGKLFSRLKAHALVSMQARLPIAQQELELGIHFTFSGLMSVYQHWFQSDRTLSLDELTKTVSRLSFYGVSDFLSSSSLPAGAESPASRRS